MWTDNCLIMVCWINDCVVRQNGGRTDLDLDFHFKITSIQIDEGFGGRDQKSHRVDSGGTDKSLLEFRTHDPRR